MIFVFFIQKKEVIWFWMIEFILFTKTIHYVKEVANYMK